MGRFGETAREHDARAGNEDEIWIKGFRTGDTTIRILQPTEDWTTYREHFSPDIKAYFPCDEEKDEDGKTSCIGCNDPAERTRKRTRKWAANCLDSEGRLSIYKFGARMRKTLVGREDRTGSITNRDYTIMRSGSGMNDTVYDIEAGPEYEIEEIPELEDIFPLLESSYERAEAMYAGTNSERVEEDEEAEEEEVTPPANRRIQPAKNAAPAKKAAPAAAPTKKAAPAKRVVKKPEPEPEPEEEAETEEEGVEPPDFDELSTKEIREWLDNYGVEYPDAAPRSRIVAIAKGYKF